MLMVKFQHHLVLLHADPGGRPKFIPGHDVRYRRPSYFESFKSIYLDLQTRNCIVSKKIADHKEGSRDLPSYSLKHPLTIAVRS